MQSSGAAIVKKSLEKYVAINLLKTRRNKYTDIHLARKSLSIAFDIIHEMDFLILSNSANDFGIIKECLRNHVGLMHKELKGRQSFLKSLFVKTILPNDFGKCVYEAWENLKSFEQIQPTPDQEFQAKIASLRQQ